MVGRLASLPASIIAAVVTIGVQVVGNGGNAARLLWTWARRPATFAPERLSVWGLSVSLLLCIGLAVSAIALVRRCAWSRYALLGLESGYGMAAALLVLSGRPLALLALCAAFAVICLLLTAPAERWLCVEAY